MKIALLAPVWLPIPPGGYGGTELVLSLLTEGLVKKGHDVTLFASGDSNTSATLTSILHTALGNDGELKHSAVLPFLHYTKCFDQADTFDIIHNHAQYEAIPLAEDVVTPVLHTIHGSFAEEEVSSEKIRILRQYSHQNFVSISNAQRSGAPDLNYVATVYNGIDYKRFPFTEKKEGYLLWIGRIAKKKGPLEAIEVVKKTGMRLKMVAAIDPIQDEYFKAEILPHIDGEQITFHGEVSNEETASFYAGAAATILPINWNEPFGLVMVESMASGTPVIAFNRGSVAEVIEDGVTGFAVDPKKGVAGLVEAVKKIDMIDKRKGRERVEKLFSVEAMVDGYEKVYEKILSSS